MSAKKRKYKPEPPNYLYWEGEPKKIFERCVKTICKRRRDLRSDSKFAAEKSLREGDCNE